jgi:hypothetical protein
MPILAPVSFNGRPIYQFPASPAFSEISFSMNDAVAVVQSPWSMQQQVQSWVGADQWACSVSLPPMLPATAQTWTAWQAVLRGKLGMFQLSDPLRAIPQGTPSGSPAINVGLAGATVINTTGWSASHNNLLIPGDYLQIGYRLHIVAGNDTGGFVNSDGSGNATFEIWPSLRDQITSATAIITNHCKGLFMLSQNVRTWSSTANEQLVAMSFKCIEAR